MVGKRNCGQRGCWCERTLHRVFERTERRLRPTQRIEPRSGHDEPLQLHTRQRQPVGFAYFHGVPSESFRAVLKFGQRRFDFLQLGERRLILSTRDGK